MRQRQNFLKHAQILAMTCLICLSLSAQNNSSSPPQNPQPPQVTASPSQSSPTNENQPSNPPTDAPRSDSPSGLCSKKDPHCSPPVPTYQPEPNYSSQAQKAHFQGVCTLYLIVGTDGRPTNIRVLSSLGMGLDEEAIKAVKKWRFKPAMRDGKPAAAEIAVQVAFHLSN
jgi:TonB family protein